MSSLDRSTTTIVACDTGSVVRAMATARWKFSVHPSRPIAQPAIPLMPKSHMFTHDGGFVESSAPTAREFG